jgi:S-adenosylmethionine hydrolase
VDRYGNAQLNLSREHLEQAGVQPGRRLEIELRGERHEVVSARTFDEVSSGGAILYEDSYRNMSLAVSRGSAAERYGARPGDQVRIHVGSP